MALITIFELFFATAMFGIGMWTCLSWAHKKYYIFMLAIDFRAAVIMRGQKISMLEAFWRISNVVQPSPTNEISFKHEAKNDD